MEHVSLTSLTRAQLEEFSLNGYVRLEQAFASSVAEECRAALNERELLSGGKDEEEGVEEIGMKEAGGEDRNAKTRIDPERWETYVERRGVAKVFGRKEMPFGKALTPRLMIAMDEVLGGRDRWEEETLGLGWWMITFPGFHEAPWGAAGHWHVDGVYRHLPGSREQGIILLMLFSTVQPGDGGTALAVGSHRPILRILLEKQARNPRFKGIHGGDLSRLARSIPGIFSNVVEATGNAGDVYLMHPLLLHARSKNLGKSIRYLCNPCVYLNEHIDLEDIRAPGRILSPLEKILLEEAKNFEIPSDQKEEEAIDKVAQDFGLPTSFGSSKSAKRRKTISNEET